MKLKNYTSTVPVERTVLRIERALITAGASGIMKEYDDNGILWAITFMVKDKGKTFSVRVPADIQAAAGVMRADMKRPRKATLKKLDEQAARTAWKIVQDWIEVEIAKIMMGQAEFTQVFLAYLWDGKKTFFDVLKEQHFKALPSGVLDKK